MRKELILYIAILGLVSWQIEGGIWKKLKLWMLQQDAGALERKLDHHHKLDKSVLLLCYEKATRLCSQVPPDQPSLLRKCESCQNRFLQLVQAEGRMFDPEEDMTQLADDTSLIRLFEEMKGLSTMTDKELDTYMNAARYIAAKHALDVDLCQRAEECADRFQRVLIGDKAEEDSYE